MARKGTLAVAAEKPYWHDMEGLVSTKCATAVAALPSLGFGLVDWLASMEGVEAVAAPHSPRFG